MKNIARMYSLNNGSQYGMLHNRAQSSIYTNAISIYLSSPCKTIIFTDFKVKNFSNLITSVIFQFSIALCWHFATPSTFKNQFNILRIVRSAAFLQIFLIALPGQSVFSWHFRYINIHWSVLLTFPECLRSHQCRRTIFGLSSKGRKYISFLI